MHSPNDSNQSIITYLPRNCAKFGGVGAAIICIILLFYEITNSLNSTSVIGFIFLPFAALIALIVGAFYGFLVGLLLQGILKRNYLYRPCFFLAIFIILATVFYCVPYICKLYSTNVQIDKIILMNTYELEQEFANLSTRAHDSHDIYLFAAIAVNPNASSEVLDKIAHLEHPMLNDRLGGFEGNRKGLAVICLVAKNSNVSLKTLEYMTDSENYYLLGDIAGNQSLPVEYLHKLLTKAQGNREGYLIEWGLASNPNTPSNILRELSKKIKYGTEFDSINSRLTRNPSTPDDVRAKLFK